MTASIEKDHPVRPGSSSSSRGFTLIEVVLTLALLGLLLPALYGILMSTLKLRNMIQEDGNPYSVGPRILDVIEHDIRGICFTNLDGTPYFLGSNSSEDGRDADRIDFFQAATEPAHRLDDLV